MLGYRSLMKGVSPRRWGKRYLLVGAIGLFLQFAGGMIPIVQRWISATETSLFYQLNRILGINPVWNGTILVTASELWCYIAYATMLALVLAHGWRIRRVDYGQIFGFIIFVAAITMVADFLADLVAENLHRLLPWRDGVVEHIKRQHGFDFFDVDRAEGIVDDATTGLCCLFLLLRFRLPRLSWAVLAFLAPYIVSNLIVGTQWLTVQASSLFLAATMAGLALLPSEKGIEYLEKKTSQWFIRLLGGLLMSRKLIDRPIAARQNEGFWKKIAEKSRAMKKRGRNPFWHGLVQEQAMRLLALDPARCELFLSPELKQERVKSSGRVRFLKTGTGEVFVLRATRNWGGVLHKSPNFVRFADSLKNNLYLQRLGFPTPSLLWIHEGLTAWGLKNYVFAIEEFRASRPLDQSRPEELNQAMELLARLHGHTAAGWGPVFQEPRGTRAHYVLQFLRDDVLIHLKRAGDILRFRLSTEELNEAWGWHEPLALKMFQDAEPPFRLTHGDVSPRNFRVEPGGAMVMIDFPTVAYDLAGWETIKAAISLTRARPDHCAAAWTAYFNAAGPEQWAEFKVQARLAFAQFALRELAHRRVKIELAHGSEKLGKRRVLRWVRELLAPETDPWGARPEETDWPAIFRLLGIHKEFAAGEAVSESNKS